MELWSTLQSAVEQVIIQQVEQFIIYCLKYIYFSHSNLPQIKSLSVDNQVKCQIFNIPLYFTGIATCIYIYIQYARMLQTTASVAQSVERWSRDPEVAGSIPSWRPWSCILCNWLSLKMSIFPTLKFTTPYFNFHIPNSSPRALSNCEELGQLQNGENKPTALDRHCIQ